ncbi:zf-HC2 domain-containing protein [Bacillus sp. SM2101]|uniref:anti-sigma factor family protein n=1 Tax=Bacillus sp. SM2101 TaxID=2805366 RepID=UPI001BDE9A80
MNCYNEELLQAYVDDELEHHERKRCEQHLVSCDTCKDKVKQLQSFNKLMEKALNNYTPITYEQSEVKEAWIKFEEKLAEQQPSLNQVNAIIFEEQVVKRKNRLKNFYSKWAVAASFLVILTGLLFIPQVNFAAKELVSKIQWGFSNSPLEYNVTRKELRDVGGNLIVYFENGKIYDKYNNTLSKDEYRQMIASYDGLNVADSSEFSIYDDAILRGIDIEGKSEEEVQRALDEDYRISMVEFDAEQIGIDINGKTELQLRNEYGEKVQDYLKETIQNSITALKGAYQIDPASFQNNSIDLTDKSDEEIKAEVYRLLADDYLKIPHVSSDQNENDQQETLEYTKVKTMHSQVLEQFFPPWVVELDNAVKKAKELNIDTEGLVGTEIINLVSAQTGEREFQ